MLAVGTGCSIRPFCVTEAVLALLVASQVQENVARESSEHLNYFHTLTFVAWDLCAIYMLFS